MWVPLLMAPLPLSATDVKFISNPPSMVAAGSVVAAVQGLHLGSSGSFLSYHRLTRFLSKVIKCDPVSDGVCGSYAGSGHWPGPGDYKRLVPGRLKLAFPNGKGWLVPRPPKMTVPHGGPLSQANSAPASPTPFKCSFGRNLLKRAGGTGGSPQAPGSSPGRGATQQAPANEPCSNCGGVGPVELCLGHSVDGR